jgi:Lon-like protease
MRERGRIRAASTGAAIVNVSPQGGGPHSIDSLTRTLVTIADDLSTGELSQRSNPRRWPIAAAIAALVLAIIAIAGWNLELDYYAFSSGPVGDAVAAVDVEGHDTFLPSGELMMLTVFGQPVNLFEAVVAGFDPDVDLVPESAVRPPDESDEEYVLRNRASMDLSTETAITVALRRLGFEITPSSDGIRVVEVADGVPAASLIQVGDVVLEVDGTAVTLVDELGPLIRAHAVGESVNIRVLRSGAEVTVAVELAPREDEPNVPMIGITAENLNPRFEFPFPIEIEAGQIGGPSAGLMYTLAVMDLLAPEELTGGHVVAGTGTIDIEGNVGPIGGIRQKVVAAEAAGAELMLVPAGNYEEALTARRLAIELIAVSTLDEALAALAQL